jgi:hypothetical protein
MAKYSEIVYMALDLLKERSDDSFYTEEHILFLASKMRALLLERKYKNSRSQTYSSVPPEDVQIVCLSLEPTELLPGCCGGMWLKSTRQLPKMLSIYEPRIGTLNGMIHSVLTFIPAERMPYVGYNKWLLNIIYAARDNDGYLYLNGQNPQFLNLESVKVSGVFANPEEAAALACESNGGAPCDLMDSEFPLEDALIPSCIELIVQELSGARYAPDDTVNNDKDDLGRSGVAQMRTPMTAENIAKRQKPVEREEEQQQ